MVILAPNGTEINIFMSIFLGKLGNFHIFSLHSPNFLKFGTFTKFGVLISFLKSFFFSIFNKNGYFGPILPQNWGKWANFLFFNFSVQIFLKFGTFTDFGLLITSSESIFFYFWQKIDILGQFYPKIGENGQILP